MRNALSFCRHGLEGRRYPFVALRVRRGPQYFTDPHMTQYLAKLRNRAFLSQSGRCFYCRLPMFISSPEELGFLAHCKGLQATAEHLHAKCDGGKNTASNIAAACRTCNSRRHQMAKPLDPDRYARHVQKKLSAGGWHPTPWLKEFKRRFG